MAAIVLWLVQIAVLATQTPPASFDAVYARLKEGRVYSKSVPTGAIRWTIPFGEYPELVAKGLRNTGSDNYGGPVVTASGLLFIGATNFDRKFHAYEARTGRLLWETTLPAAGNATPAMYEVDGRQFVVIACGGGKGSASGGSYVAFALPKKYALKQ